MPTTGLGILDDAKVMKTIRKFKELTGSLGICVQLSNNKK